MHTLPKPSDALNPYLQAACYIANATHSLERNSFFGSAWECTATEAPAS